MRAVCAAPCCWSLQEGWRGGGGGDPMHAQTNQHRQTGTNRFKFKSKSKQTSNGTQQIFYEDPRVLVISIHQVSGLLSLRTAPLDWA